MSCWVVPSLAAELWRMPLEQVLKLVRDGAVPSKEEEGFTFIDVAPESPRMESAKATPHAPALLAGADEDDVDVLLVDGDAELLEAADDSFGDWREARQRISLTRIGPPRTRLICL